MTDLPDHPDMAAQERWLWRAFLAAATAFLAVLAAVAWLAR